MTTQEKILSHPYCQYVCALNMTECYKTMLFAGDKHMVQYVPDPIKYKELRKDFKQKYPYVVKEWRKAKPNDCNIL